MSSGYFPLGPYSDFPAEKDELIACAKTLEKVINTIRPSVYELDCTEDGINDAFYLSELSIALGFIKGAVRE